MCSTPIGGALARLAAKKKDIKPVLYEAHGFLFFKGAPLINQTVYKWEEKLLAHYTDILITITNEDYAAAQKFKLRSGERPYLVHGAGVKVDVRVEINRTEKRRSVGVPEDAFVIVSAGELNKNKNTEVVVRSLKDVPRAHYVACGVGPEKENLEKLAEELGVSERFHLMGYRTDMAELMAMSDVFTMMSFREGMPRSLRTRAAQKAHPGERQQLHTLHLHLEEHGDLPGIEQDQSDPFTAARSTFTLSHYCKVRGAGYQPDEAGVKAYTGQRLRVHVLL